MLVYAREDLRRTTASYPSHDDRQQASVPQMCGRSLRACEYVLARLCQNRSSLKIFTWATPGDTLYLSEPVLRKYSDVSWISVDHHVQRCRTVTKARDVDHRLFFLPPEPDYFFVPTVMAKWDLVLIAGIRLQECLRYAQSLLASDGVVLLYDPKYLLHNLASSMFTGGYIYGSPIWRGSL